MNHEVGVELAGLGAGARVFGGVDLADVAPPLPTVTSCPTQVTLPSEGTRTVRLPHSYRSAREARHVLVSDLGRRGVPQVTVEEAESVVAELFVNAVQHASPLPDGCVRVHWKVKAGAVEVEVRDGGGDTEPRPNRPSVWATRGRGLRIVRSLAHEWGVQEERNGRTVWAALGGPSRRRRV